MSQPITPINKVVPIEAIKAHPENYNMHPDDQLKQLGASYTELGQFRSAVLWAQPDGSYIQLAGHGVVEAMKREGATEVRADILPSSLDPVVAKRIMLADNLHAQNSTPDDELLAQLLQEQKDAGYNLAALGSSDETLRQMLATLGDEYVEAGEGEEAIPGIDAPDLPYKNQFAVAVMCESESQQQQVFEALQKQGYTCKVLVV